MRPTARRQSTIRRSWLFAILGGGLCLAGIGIVGPAAGSQATSPEVVRLANGEWPPYTGADLPNYGCDSQVVSEALALEGMRVQYSFLPWARGLLLSQNGVLDGAIEWAATPTIRQHHFVSKTPLSHQQWVFFQRADRALHWQQLDQLTGVTIGITIGYSYSGALAALQRSRPEMFAEAASDLSNFKKLLSGRIDLFPLEKQVGRTLMQRYLTMEEQSQLIVAAQPLADFAPHLLLSRAVVGNEQRLQRFEQGLARLLANGRYREIMARCLPEMSGSPEPL